MPSAATASSARCAKPSATFAKPGCRATTSSSPARSRAPFDGAELARSAAGSVAPCRRVARICSGRHNAGRPASPPSTPDACSALSLPVAHEPDPPFPVYRLADGGGPAVDGVGQGDRAPPQAPAPTAAATGPGAGPRRRTERRRRVPSVPGAPATQVASAPTPAAPASGPAVTVTTDVLQVDLDGGELHRADLLKYPSTADRNSAPVRLFDDAPGRYFAAQSGWVSQAGAAPSHEQGFRVEGNATDFTLADGSNQVDVPFVWTGANGVTMRRTYTFDRGNYVVKVRDEVVNAGNAPWQGYVYRQLSRVPRALTAQGSDERRAVQLPRRRLVQRRTTSTRRRKFDDFVDDGAARQARHRRLDRHAAAPLLHRLDPGRERRQRLLAGHAVRCWRHAVPDPRARPRRRRGARREARAPKRACGSARSWSRRSKRRTCRASTAPSTSASFSFMATLAGWLFWLLAKIYRWSATGAGRSSAWSC